MSKAVLFDMCSENGAVIENAEEKYSMIQNVRSITYKTDFFARTDFNCQASFGRHKPRVFSSEHVKQPELFPLFTPNKSNNFQFARTRQSRIS